MSEGVLEAGYLAPSLLDEDRRRLGLSTGLGATPTGLVAHPTFFRGFLDRPDVAAAGLLAVADVAANRYADPGLGQRLASLDPIVTAGGDRLRFESFSACNGVHARLDLLPDGLGSSEVGWGTTNVDVNPSLRAALARVHPDEALHLSVGLGELRASTPTTTHVERKVRLPERWIRGLAEVSVISAAMAPAFALDGAAARRLLGTLPRVSPPGPDLHLLPTPRGVKQLRTPSKGSVPLPGASRVRGADRIARFTTRLAVHQHPSSATAWVFDLPGARFTLVISAGAYRGFSGEGGLLTLLSTPDVERTATHLQAELGWNPTVDPNALARSSGLSRQAVAAGLSWLAAAGRLGHDLTDSRWFHRELPIDATAILRRNPRLVAAQRLVDAAAVAPAEEGWTVASGDRRYDVPFHATSCTCQWTIDSPDRGPCKHRLAVLLSER